MPQLGHLLGDGRAAVTFEEAAPLRAVDIHGRDDPARADSEMPVKAFVLGRDHRIAQIGRDIVRGDIAAKGLAAPGKDLTLVVKQRDRAARAAVQQIGDRWQLAVEIEDDTADDHRGRQPDAPENRPDRAQNHTDDSCEEIDHRIAAAPALARALPAGLARATAIATARADVSARVCAPRSALLFCASLSCMRWNVEK
jgi:hypothetical protein